MYWGLGPNLGTRQRGKGSWVPIAYGPGPLIEYLCTHHACVLLLQKLYHRTGVLNIGAYVFQV